MTHPEYLEVTRYPPLMMGMRWVFFHVCAGIAVCSLVCNFIPHEARYANRPRALKIYRFFVHYLAFLALNWRHCLPSLDLEFMGFHRGKGKRIIFHARADGHGVRR